MRFIHSKEIKNLSQAREQLESCLLHTTSDHAIAVSHPAKVDTRAEFAVACFTLSLYSLMLINMAFFATVRIVEGPHQASPFLQEYSSGLR